MNTQLNDPLGTIRSALQHCAEILGEIAATCCMPARSTAMDAAFRELQQSLSVLEQSNSDAKAAQLCIEHIGHLGAKVGFLYATCCTEVREPLYQRMFKEMNKAHSALWVVLGHGH
jgi:hypothetical protein